MLQAEVAVDNEAFDLVEFSEMSVIESLVTEYSVD
jgi:hypothetical protein